MKSEAFLQISLNGSPVWRVITEIPGDIVRRMRPDQLKYLEKGVVELIRDSVELKLPQEPEPSAVKRGGRK